MKYLKWAQEKYCQYGILSWTPILSRFFTVAKFWKMTVVFSSYKNPVTFQRIRLWRRRISISCTPLPYPFCFSLANMKLPSILV